MTSHACVTTLRSPTRFLVAAALGTLVAVTPAVAGPGDPLGGDDTGCAPSTKLGLSCAKKALGALTKFRRSVVSCHLTQAQLTFQIGMGTPGSSNAEENCEEGPSNTSAKAKLDKQLVALTDKGCDATMLANAYATRDLLLGDQTVAGSLDHLNGRVFCDSASGALIDPGGDDGGFIPATPENLRCSVTVLKAWTKLDGYLYRCHTKLAAAVFAGKPFDEEACEDVGDRSALAKYNAILAKLLLLGYCPPCLADPLSPDNALGLGTGLVADADATLGSTFICPGP